MLKRLILVVVVGSSFLFCGCFNSGNTKLAKTNNQQMDAMIVKGQTTKENIRTMFGDPDDTDIGVDGKTKWIYLHVKKSQKVRNFIPVVRWVSSGTNDTKKKLVIIFNNEEIVEDFSCSTGKGETTFGLF